MCQIFICFMLFWVLDITRCSTSADAEINTFNPRNRTRLPSLAIQIVYTFQNWKSNSSSAMCGQLSLIFIAYYNMNILELGFLNQLFQILKINCLCRRVCVRMHCKMTKEFQLLMTVLGINGENFSNIFRNSLETKIMKCKNIKMKIERIGGKL